MRSHLPSCSSSSSSSSVPANQVRSDLDLFKLALKKIFSEFVDKVKELLLIEDAKLKFIHDGLQFIEDWVSKIYKEQDDYLNNVFDFIQFENETLESKLHQHAIQLINYDSQISQEQILDYFFNKIRKFINSNILMSFQFNHLNYFAYKIAASCNEDKPSYFKQEKIELSQNSDEALAQLKALAKTYEDKINVMVQSFLETLVVVFENNAWSTLPDQLNDICYRNLSLNKFIQTLEEKDRIIIAEQKKAKELQRAEKKESKIKMLSEELFVLREKYQDLKIRYNQLVAENAELKNSRPRKKTSSVGVQTLFSDVSCTSHYQPSSRVKEAQTSDDNENNKIFSPG